MGYQLEIIGIELEKAIKHLAKEQGSELASRIKPILYANLGRGRIEGFIESNISLVRDYVYRVAEQYQLQCSYLEKIQIERSTEVWESLFNQMQQWAYNFLLKKGYDTHLATAENAAECATDAAIIMLKAHFPYDTDFKPWAHVIVQNACHKFIRARLKKSIIPDEELVSIEDLLENLKDHFGQDQNQQKELSATLRSAIARLSETRQKVIMQIYFQDMSITEISQTMGKSHGAIHSLHFNGLHDLQKILSENRDNINE